MDDCQNSKAFSLSKEIPPNRAFSSRELEVEHGAP